MLVTERFSFLFLLRYDDGVRRLLLLMLSECVCLLMTPEGSGLATGRGLVGTTSDKIPRQMRSERPRSMV